MNKSLKLLRAGFESSSGLTPEFDAFSKVFTKEITKELADAGATDIQVRRGHFDLRGNYTVGTQTMYFSLPDVRGGGYPIGGVKGVPIMYRTCKDYQDYTGGTNRWTELKTGVGFALCGK